MMIKNKNKFGARKVYAVTDAGGRVLRFHTLKAAQDFALSAQDNPAVMAFASIHEFDVYKELFHRERRGEITDLARQVVFELLPNQYEKTTGKNGKPARKLQERRIIYTADFVYYENGARVVVDAKSKATRTRDYIMRRKMMLYKYGIKIVEM